MDDRQPPDRNDTPPSRSAPSPAGHDEHSPNDRPDRHGSDPSIDDRHSPSRKPPLTERERRERWPLG